MRGYAAHWARMKWIPRSTTTLHARPAQDQICMALTSLGVKPPNIDAWEYGVDDGRVVEIPPDT
jgi:hypothetical protein